MKSPGGTRRQVIIHVAQRKNSSYAYFRCDDPLRLIRTITLRTPLPP